MRYAVERIVLGVFGGLKLWGDWFNTLTRSRWHARQSKMTENPLLQRISLMDISLILGAFFGPHCYPGSFAVRRPTQAGVRQCGTWRLTDGYRRLTGRRPAQRVVSSRR